VDNDIVARMREEEADLARKLAAVRQFLAAYDSNTDDGGAAAGTNRYEEVKKRETQRGKVGIDGYGEYGRQIVAIAMMAMIDTAEPVRTRKIVEYLDAAGVHITGENKINAVGALLSRSNDIVSHGKRGWTLADESTARSIIQHYALNENEAPSDTSPEPQRSAVEGAPTPFTPGINLLS
jgi:hypothetical protein